MEDELIKVIRRLLGIKPKPEIIFNTKEDIISFLNEERGYVQHSESSGTMEWNEYMVQFLSSKTPEQFRICRYWWVVQEWTDLPISKKDFIRLHKLRTGF